MAPSVQQEPRDAQTWGAAATHSMAALGSTAARRAEVAHRAERESTRTIRTSLGWQRSLRQTQKLRFAMRVNTVPLNLLGTA